MSNFNVNYFQIHSAVRQSVAVFYYTRVHTVICMYMQNVHAKYEHTKQKKRGKDPGCSSINTTVLNKCYFLWLEKTMLAPTCTISSLLILTITVRRTRWSVGRRVLRVVTQAYQGDEETRLTEPRYCWPTTTLHTFPPYWANSCTFRIIYCVCTMPGEASLLSFIWKSKQNGV